MAKPEDKASTGPRDRERLAPSQAVRAGETSFGVLGIPEPVVRLRRTWGVWQVPELDSPQAEALMELWPQGSFLVIGHNPSQVLILKTGPSPGEVNTYQIKKLPAGVSLESSNICMPDLLHLLAFLSASRDVLPRTLLLPPPMLSHRDQHTGPLQSGSIQVTAKGRVLSLVNKLYLETHGAWGAWGVEQVPPEAPLQTARKQDPAPRNASPHRVSWVEGPLSPEDDYPGPTLTSLVEEKEEEVEEEEQEQEKEKEEDDYKEEEEEAEDELTRHIRALVRARNSYVARQFRSFRARLTSDSGGPHRPGDPATELLQDVRHLLTDLQDHLAEDPDVRAFFGSRGPGAPQKDINLGSSLEAALCRAVLSPLKPLLWKRLRTLRAPELRRLRRRQIALRAEAGPPGGQGTVPKGQGPASALRSRIHARLAHLHAACAPRRKVALLLAVCSDVYAGLAPGENHGNTEVYVSLNLGRAPRGRRLSACADRGADLEPRPWGNAIRRGVSNGAFGSRRAAGRGRVLPDHVVWSAAPHRPLPARGGPRTPGAQQRGPGFPAPVAPQADAAQICQRGRPGRPVL